VPATRPRPRPAELLGGRWATSVRVWLISSVALLLTVPGVTTLSGAETDVIVKTVALQWLLLSVLYVGAHFTMFRNSRTSPVALPWVIAFWLLLGITRFITILVGARGDSGPLHTVSGVITTAASVIPGTLVAVLLITYVIAVNDWYAGERARLLRFEVNAEATRLRTSGALSAARAVATQRIRTDLEQRLETLDRAASSGIDPGLSDALLDAASTSVRPASHALWAQANTPSTRRPEFRALERASLSTPLPVLLPFVLWFVIAVPSIAIKATWALAAAGALMALAGMAIFYPLGSAAIRRLAPPPHFARARIIGIASMVVATLPALIAWWLTAPAGHGFLGQAPWARLALVGTLIVLTVLVTWVQTGLRMQEADIRALRTQVEETEMERLALEEATERMQHDLARHLHSTVQAGLVASAYAIQDAVNRGDQVALERAIAEARVAVARVDADEAPPTTHDLQALRDAIDATWQGMLSISWELPSSPPPAEAVQRIGNVVQECLANASIHGAASAVTVRISADAPSGEVVVEVADNGTGLGEGAPGLGSAVLTEATGGSWTIAPAPSGGAEVRARITA